MIAAALFFVLGAGAGSLEVALLRRSARPGAGPLLAPLRLALVSAALLAAAVSGHLLAGALGWAAAFVVGAALVLRRWS